MRVLVLCTDAYGGHGGIALHARDLIEAIASHRDVEEVVAMPRLIVRELEPIPDNVRFVTRAAGGAAAYMRELTRAGRAFDLVVCTHINLVPVATLLRRKTVSMLHGIEAWKPLPRTPARLVNTLDAVIAVSGVTRERFLAWSQFGGATFVLPNAIHLERFGMRPRNEELVRRWNLTGKRVLLTLGRIVAAERYKGFDEVLDVLPDLLRDCPDVVYLIAGDGNDVPRLLRKAVRLGVEQRVVFTGRIAEHEKTDLYNLADVYVMPSRGEGFGFVFLEALACGVPVIASRYDGSREAVREGELGTLVDPANLAEVRIAIEDVLASPQRGIPEGLKYFAYPRFEARVHEVIEQLSS